LRGLPCGLALPRAGLTTMRRCTTERRRRVRGVAALWRWGWGWGRERGGGAGVLWQGTPVVYQGRMGAPISPRGLQCTTLEHASIVPAEKGPQVSSRDLHHKRLEHPAAYQGRQGTPVCPEYAHANTAGSWRGGSTPAVSGRGGGGAHPSGLPAREEAGEAPLH